MIKAIHLISPLNITASFESSNVLFASKCMLIEKACGDVRCIIGNRSFIIRAANIAAVEYDSLEEPVKKTRKQK